MGRVSISKACHGFRSVVPCWPNRPLISFPGPVTLAAMTTMSELIGPTWRGQAELWLDPLGNEVQTSDCSITLDQGVVRYTWAFKGEAQKRNPRALRRGSDLHRQLAQSEAASVSISPRELGAARRVSAPTARERGPTGAGAPRSAAVRAGELVLQMTNIAPWGEDGRAVRMILHPGLTAEARLAQSIPTPRLRLTRVANGPHWPGAYPARRRLLARRQR